MILNFFREGVCQAGETANAHPHRKVLPLNMTGADMLRIGTAAHDSHIATDATGRRIARLVIHRSAVNLL